MANTYNVYLRKRLTEFDIIIQNLPYRDGLIFHSKMYLDAMLNYLFVQKFIVGSHDAEHQTKIDDLLERVMNAFHNSATLTFGAETLARKPISGNSNALLHSSNPIILEESFNIFSNFINLSTRTLQYDIAKSVGKGSIEMVLSTKAAKTLKTAFERFRNDVHLKGHVNPSAVKFSTAGHTSVLSMDQADLFYLLNVQCETFFNLLCAGDIELWYTLGNGNSSFCLSTHMKQENM